ncbi:MAG: exodeoxyribonuclease V subunit gamma [Nocardioidaceae bacterium]
MTLHLHRADRADRLADELAALLAVPLADPFAEEYVVVPARGVERWLTQRLSHRLGVGAGREDGVCAGVRFVSPRSLVSLLLGRERDDPWDPDRLVWPLLAVIDASVGEPWCPALSAHLGAGRTGEDARTRHDRRYAVARRLAGLFASYAVQRPELVSDWTDGFDTDGLGRALVPDLAWQGELWRRVVAEVGEPPPHRRHEDTVAAIRSGAELALPDRLSMFGHTRLPRTEIELLGAVSTHRDVHLWLPQASGELWHELTGVVAAGPVPRDEDHSGREVRHRLLGSLGRDSRELQRGLAVLRDPMSHESPSPATTDTLLGWLQDDLRSNRPPGGAGRALRPDDRTVQVHACHGTTRQVDVLREVLVGLLQDDPTLEPRDIVVMCPDIDTYAPLIHAGFGLDDLEAAHPAHRLRVRLADRALANTNPLLALTQRLVALAGGRVTATEVLDLAAEVPVRLRFGFSDDDLVQLTRWVEAAGIRWGFDAAHRSAYDLATVRQNTWRTGLDRLLLGVAMAEDEHSWLGTTLPVDDVSGNEISLAGRFTELVDRLERAVDDLLDPGLTDRLAVLAEHVTGLSRLPGRDAWQQSQFERELAAIAPSAGSGPLGLADLRALLEDRLGGRPTRANFRTGTLTVCTMVPMRSVPHRVVCLVGLDDGVFPRNPSIDGDDVLARRPVTGERDGRSEDRQLLLDAVMAATETLVITYSGANEHTGQVRPPAVPLGELLDVLDETTPAPVTERVLRRHPLQPFDVRNLVPDADGVPFSFDETARAGALAANGPRTNPPAFLDGPLPAVEPPPDVTLDELREFFRHPAQAFLRRRLDITLPRAADELGDSIPIELDSLQKWAVGDRVLTRLVGGQSGDSVTFAEVIRGSVPPGALGTRVLRELLDPIEALLTGSASARAAGARTVEIAHDLGGRRLTGTVPDVYGDALVRLTYSSLSARQRLPAWIDLLALLLCYPDIGWGASTWAKGKGGVKRATLSLVDPEEARSHLDALLDVYDRGMREPIPLPLKTACAFAESSHSGRTNLAEKMARGQWETDRFNDHRPPGEQDDAAWVRVYGEVAPLEVLLGRPRRGESWSSAPHRLGQYAWRVWKPLLDHEVIR